MPPFPSILPDEPKALEKLIAAHEDAASPLKKDNEAKIIWADDHQKQQTPYSIVYLHGFTASRGEAAPLHENIARKFGCNLYLARLHGHGLKREHHFRSFSVKKLLRSVTDACRIGQKIGKNVLVMGTSTGAALGLYAAGSRDCPVSVKGLILYSPLIHFYGFRSLFLENKIGRGLARLLRGSDFQYSLHILDDEAAHIWYPNFPLSAALTLGKMVQTCLNPALYKRVKCPVFIGYYYQNEKNHDRVVSTHAIKKLARKLGAPTSLLQIHNFPEAESHVIASGLVSKAVPAVMEQTELFLQGKIGLSIAE